MIYRNVPSKYLLLILMALSYFNTHAQGLDSVYIVPNTPFLSKIISIPDLNTSVNLSPETNIIPLNNPIIASNGQKLYKNGKEIYIFIEQTGFLYKLMKYDTSICVFKRLDHTVNLNYNINCKNFIYNNEIYSYGGYGFWKSNGHLRKYNFQDSEWDIIPLNKEIISTYYLWFSETQGRLYLPFQRIVNAGLTGSENIVGVPIYTSYYLDLKSNKWEKLGNMESDVEKIVKNVNTSFENLSYNDGIMFLTNDDAYLFDYVHNKVFRSKNSDLNQFLIRRANMSNMFIYKNEIFSYNSGSKVFVKYPFRITDFELLRTSIWGDEVTLFYIMTAIVAFALFLLGAKWFFNKSVKRKLETAQLQLLKNKSVAQAFTGTEVSLIKLLLETTIKGKVVEINQINHILGIKDKNIGLQKKVRSDVMKAINDKYEFITQSTVNLIGSSRKLDDKRFYEYFITASELKAIQRILENNE